MSPAGANPRPVAARYWELIVPIGLIGAIVALVVPVAPALLDLLLAANMTAAVLILLQTVQVRRPLEFSVFPSLLLTTTLSRLVLNVASTRLILTADPADGTSAAGGVIAGFGEFVAGGSPYVGGVVFAILVAIQFLVITKGAMRISEVAARFTLDGLPGRQASVDADLAAGLITPAEARQQRQEILRQADFYGAMDGAGKFVRGDAVAGLLITAVNILGGLAIGILQQGLSLQEAVALYTTLTIGDGLVSQVPALLISLAAGLIVTRNSTVSDLPRETVGQMIAHPLPLLLAAGFLTLMGFTGFPIAPMLGLAALCCGLAVWVSPERTETRRESTAAGSPVVLPLPATAGPAATPGTTATTPPLTRHLQVEPVELNLGVSLVRLADASAGGDLLERVTQLRERIAADLGFILPKVRIQDDLRLDPREYRIKLRGVPEPLGTVYVDSLLAVNDGFVDGTLPGLEGVEPATGRAGVWIDANLADEARTAGYRLVLPQVVILQQLEQTVRRHAGTLLTREHVHELLQHLRQRTPHLVDDLVPARLSGGEIHRVLGELLDEGVPIRDLESILEALGDAVVRRPHYTLADLTADVRLALRRTIVQKCTDNHNVLHVVLVESADRARLERDLELTATFQPDRHRLEHLIPWLGRLTTGLDRLVATGHPPVVVCRNDCRVPLRDLLRQLGVPATVLGHRELPGEIEIKLHAEIELGAEETSPPVNTVRLSQAAHLTVASHHPSP